MSLQVCPLTGVYAIVTCHKIIFDPVMWIKVVISSCLQSMHWAMKTKSEPMIEDANECTTPSGGESLTPGGSKSDQATNGQSIR